MLRSVPHRGGAHASQPAKNGAGPPIVLPGPKRDFAKHMLGLQQKPFISIYVYTSGILRVQVADSNSALQHVSMIVLSNIQQFPFFCFLKRESGKLILGQNGGDRS